MVPRNTRQLGRGLDTPLTSLGHPKLLPNWRFPASLMLLGSLIAAPGIVAADDGRCTINPQNPTIAVGAR